MDDYTSSEMYIIPDPESKNQEKETCASDDILQDQNVWCSVCNRKVNQTQSLPQKMESSEEKLKYICIRCDSSQKLFDNEGDKVNKNTSLDNKGVIIKNLPNRTEDSRITEHLPMEGDDNDIQSIETSEHNSEEVKSTENNTLNAAILESVITHGYNFNSIYTSRTGSVIDQKSKLEKKTEQERIQLYLDEQELQLQKRRYACTMCNKRFKRNSHLQRHMQTHTDIGPTFTCDVCDKRYRDSNNLMRHKKSHLTDSPFIDKPYTCGICDRKFRDNHDLQRHLRIHTGEMPFKCPICERGFIDNRSMQKHIKDHKGERLCVCPICNKGFIDNRALNRHIRTYKGEMHYKCDICTKTFVKESSLLSHVKLHNEPPKFKCKFCDESYRYRKNLRIHLKTHTESVMFSTNSDSEDDNDMSLQSYDEKASPLNMESVKGEVDSDVCSSSTEDIHVHVQPPLNTDGEAAKTAVIGSEHQQFCKKNFSSDLNLKIHCKFQHATSSMTTSSENEQSTLTSSTTGSEIGQTSFKCKYCNESFAVEDEFQRHRKIHVNQMDFILSFGDKGHKNEIPEELCQKPGRFSLDKFGSFIANSASNSN